MAVSVVAVVEGALVWATTMVPVVGVFVWTPMLFIAMIPVVVRNDADDHGVKGH